VSCGAIILYCLNLPLSIRFLPENTFIIGMTPAPHAPTVWTISHILDSVQSIVMELDLPGNINSDTSDLSDGYEEPEDNDAEQGSQHGSTSGLTDDLEKMEVDNDALPGPSMMILMLMETTQILLALLHLPQTKLLYLMMMILMMRLI